MGLDVLVVEDEYEIAELMKDILTDEKFTVRIAKDSIQAFQEIGKKVPNIIILDIWLQNSPLDGIGILERVKTLYKLLPVVMISGHGTIENVVHAIKIGAYDYITKPFSQDKLLITIKRAYESAQLKKENKILKIKIDNTHKIIGDSESSNKLRSDITKIPNNARSILLVGEEGTEKQTVARILHSISDFSNRPLLCLNTSGLQADQVEKVLFGDKDDDNADSILPKKMTSLVEKANGGTIYIPNIITLSIEVQKKLLRFLQDSILQISQKKINVKIIAGITEKYLKDYSYQDLLYPQLYKKLQNHKIKIPRLSDRKKDIQKICAHYINMLCNEHNCQIFKLSNSLVSIFEEYDWPLNTSELRNTLEWIVLEIKAKNLTSNIIDEKILYEITQNPPAIVQFHNKMQYGQFKTKEENNFNNIDINLPLKQARNMFERYYLLSQMKKMNNNISKTAQFIGMERSALHRKLTALNISTVTQDKKI